MATDYINKIYEGDCLQVLPTLPDGIVDLILCDLPYGATQNKWDTPIDLKRLWKEYKRLLKPNGVVVLTSMGRFTGQVIESNPGWFKYKMVWIKNLTANFLNVHKQPLRKHEDICVFYRRQPYYNAQKVQGKPYNKGTRKANRSDSYGAFGPIKMINKDGLRYPYDLFFLDAPPPDYIYCKTAKGDGVFHPTQKPVELGRTLIRMFTRPGEIVLDNACGSGTFLVGAVLENRKFIGIEKNKMSYHMGKAVDFIAICRMRIENAQRAPKLPLE